jgi:hypothetical protein
MICDVECFAGAWPFRSLPDGDLGGLARMVKRFGVKRVALSALEEVFWEDRFEATRRLAERVSRKRWISQFQVLNPAFPGWQKDLERGVRDLRVKGIRLVPGYHGYALTAPCVGEAVAAAREHALPLVVHVRLQDERMHWMAKFPPVAVREIIAFLEQTASLRIAIVGCELTQIKVIAEAVKRRPQTWVDWSRLRAMLFGIEKLLQAIPARQILYGSLWPLQTPSAVLNLMTIARISKKTRSLILWQNGQRFIGG